MAHAVTPFRWTVTGECPASPALCLSRPNGARGASQICDPAGILDFVHAEALSLGRTVWTPKPLDI